jgi:hypothetical protein
VCWYAAEGWGREATQPWSGQPASPAMGSLRRSSSLGSGTHQANWVKQLTYPVLALGLLGCAATLWLLAALLGDHDHAMQGASVPPHGLGFRNRKLCSVREHQWAS